MTVLFDIGHPAHVHLFKNPAEILRRNGIKTVFLARDKDVTIPLLKELALPFETGSRQRAGRIGLLIEFIQWMRAAANNIRKHRADLVASIGSPAGACAARTLGIQHIAFNDTECSSRQRALYAPASKKIFTPDCFQLDLGLKQVRYPGYHELAYLRDNRFQPDPDVLRQLELKPGQPFAILRFVDKKASHDLGSKTIDDQTKINIANQIQKHAQVIISSEAPLPRELEPLRWKLHPARVHHALAFASLLLGESATMASEAAVLGVPAIFVDNLGRGYTREQEERYQAVFNFPDNRQGRDNALRKAIDILQDNDTPKKWAEKKERIRKEKIDVADYIAQQCQHHARTQPTPRP